MIPLWIVFALISSLAAALASIVIRYVLKNHDWVSFSFVTHTLAAVFFIPLILLNPTFPSNSYAWTIVVLSIIIWTIAIMVAYKSYQMIEVSERSPLAQTKMLFILIISVLFLSETLTTSKLLGTLSIFFGAVLITLNKNKPFARLNERGIQLTLFATLLMAIAWVIDKVAMGYWSPEIYGFLLFLFPGIITGIITLKRKDKFFTLMRRHKLMVIFASLLYVALYLFRLKAFILTEASNVSPVIGTSTLFSVIGGIVLLKERKHIVRKLISAIIMIIGVLFISGYLVI